ncbi:hypothetical protein EES39_38795 [Streptomyces sp. ADI92-24]|uniref:DUF397 domain-containing protein n=1 Tax=Streptomyces sp. ADI92-24 TaxID=1522756 RepID=UPI000F54D3B5|nr:DUF397 domain-containing protein [Streptomyces sp. ADI92-24]RPK32439.1 hypothetical protein EES39_38795 [Streptomyces sp. ADI92-24]
MTNNRTIAAPELAGAGAVWQKSSYSDGAGNNCVEVADLTSTAYAGIAIRDSKVPEGPALHLSVDTFVALISGVCTV